jgi:hypothetical protein
MKELASRTQGMIGNIGKEVDKHDSAADRPFIALSHSAGNPGLTKRKSGFYFRISTFRLSALNEVNYIFLFNFD